jgi:hypothetical protein
MLTHDLFDTADDFSCLIEKRIPGAISGIVLFPKKLESQEHSY